MKRQTAEVSSMTAFAKDLRLHRGRGPQGLRRLRFSFFLFTCQTAREQNSAPNLSVARKADEARHPRTAGWRVTVPVMSFRGASSRRNAVAGADGSYIGGGPIRCQPRKSEISRRFLFEIFSLATDGESQQQQTLSADRPDFNAAQKPYSWHLLGKSNFRGDRPSGRASPS